MKFKTVQRMAIIIKVMTKFNYTIVLLCVDPRMSLLLGHVNNSLGFPNNYGLKTIRIKKPIYSVYDYKVYPTYHVNWSVHYYMAQCLAAGTKVRGLHPGLEIDLSPKCTIFKPLLVFIGGGV